MMVQKDNDDNREANYHSTEFLLHFVSSFLIVFFFSNVDYVFSPFLLPFKLKNLDRVSKNS